MATRRAALIGDAFVDVQVGGVGALPCWGTDVACSSVRLLPGGACGNTARQLGALGGCELEAFFYSCVGDDEPGRHYLRTLEAEGSLTSPSCTLRLVPGVPQSCCVILSGSEDRAMCSCYETVHRVTTGLFSAELLADSWALVHLGGYFNCVGLHDDELLDLLRALKAAWSEHGMAARSTPCVHTSRCEPRRAARCSPWTRSTPCVHTSRCERRAALCSPWTRNTTAPASGAARAATYAGFRR